jgi:heme/copper-type cytochrome/quinol oxidase subunit 1
MYSVIPVGWQLGHTTASQGDTLYVLIGGAVLGGFAALHYWLPKVSGRLVGEGLSKIALGTILLGAHLYVIPMFLAGLAGQPVDVYKYFSGTDLSTFNLIASIGAFFLAAGILLELGARPRLRSRPAQRPRSVGGDDARVVRALAPAAAQLRRCPRRPQPGAAPRHP